MAKDKPIFSRYACLFELKLKVENLSREMRIDFSSHYYDYYYQTNQKMSCIDIEIEVDFNLIVNLYPSNLLDCLYQPLAEFIFS